MAVTVVANTATELSGAKISTDSMKIGSRLFTNAEILALPSGVVEIVAAVSSKVLIPIWAIIITKFGAGAYTNVHSGGNSTTQPYFSIELNGGAQAGMTYGYNLTSESIEEFTELFTNTVRQVVGLGMFHHLVATFGEIGTFVNNLSDSQGNIVLHVSNAGDGNFTGGNAANSMIVYVGYAELTVP